MKETRRSLIKLIEAATERMHEHQQDGQWVRADKECVLLGQLIACLEEYSE